MKKESNDNVTYVSTYSLWAQCNLLNRFILFLKCYYYRSIPNPKNREKVREKERNPKLSTCKWFAVCQFATHNKAKVAVIQHDKKVKWIERNCQSNDGRNLAAIDFSSVGRREWRLSDRALVKLILGRLWHIFLGLVCKSIFFLFKYGSQFFVCYY